MKVISIVGTRPQFVKLAPLTRAFDRHNASGGEFIEHLIVHTGQHYDVGLSAVFFVELGIPRPAFHLEVGSGPHGRQTGQMLDRVEQALIQARPAMAIVYGDTNSAVAGVLAAAKLHIPVAHVEAGLRSFNRSMPEEINRVVVDHVADLLLAPTPTAMDNLVKEGLSAKALWTGDVMYDATLGNRQLAGRRPRILEQLALEPGQYGVVTAHRAENTDDEKRLGSLLTAFNDIAASEMPLVFPLHPRTAKMLSLYFPTWSAHPRLHLIEPLGYLDMLAVVDHARLTLTDSGGLQKEAFFLDCPCITLREETEWVETLTAGGNMLVGVEPAKIRAAVSAWNKRSRENVLNFSAERVTVFGDGHAAEKITDALLTFFHKGASA